MYTLNTMTVRFMSVAVRSQAPISTNKMAPVTAVKLKFKSRLTQLLNFKFRPIWVAIFWFASHCSVYGKSFLFLAWHGGPGKKALKFAESDSSIQPGSRRAKSARTTANPEVIPPSLLAKTTSHHSLQSALQLSLPQLPDLPTCGHPFSPTHLNYLPTYLPCQNHQCKQAILELAASGPTSRFKALVCLFSKPAFQFVSSMQPSQLHVLADFTAVSFALLYWENKQEHLRCRYSTAELM